MQKKELTVAVVGALGAVGTEMLSILEASSLPFTAVIPMDTPGNAGKHVLFKGQEMTVIAAEAGAFNGVDIALFSAGGAASKILSPIAVSEGAVVIDNSNAFRMDTQVPLVIPEVNPHDAENHQGIIANPNCSTIQMLTALNPLHDQFQITRIVVSTYQAVSGAGLPGIEELKGQSSTILQGKEPVSEVFPRQIAFNAVPHIDVFLENGYSREEMKMVYETRKILGNDTIRVCPTAVRVPVFRCHAESINIETVRPMPDEDSIRRILDGAEGVKVMDEPLKNLYPTPAELKGTNEVCVGRIRKDDTVENGLNLWVVADNVRKGAALNAVQIAELIVYNDWLLGGRDA